MGVLRRDVSNVTMFLYRNSLRQCLKKFHVHLQPEREREVDGATVTHSYFPEAIQELTLPFKTRPLQFFRNLSYIQISFSGKSLPTGSSKCGRNCGGVLSRAECNLSVYRMSQLSRSQIHFEMNFRPALKICH